MSRVFVTGIGLVTPLGLGVQPNLVGLRAGRCGITSMEYTLSKFASLLPFGEVKFSNDQLCEMLQVESKGITRTSLLSLLAFQEAIQQSNISLSELQQSSTALVGASTVGGMCLTDELYSDANKLKDASDYISSYDGGSVALYLQQKYKIGGIINTFNTACSSSANAIMYGARLIKHGLAKTAIVGGADSLAKFTINGFNSLRILSKNKCTPFDAHRSGLNLGEGAAYLVLQGEETIQDQKIFAELTGYSNANDAFHPTSLSDDGDGPYASMQQALTKADINPSDISFINTHGTGTENNDLIESIAMKRLFQTVPLFASTKSNIGHTLGAASAIEAAFSIFSILHQEVYPHINFTESIAETGLTPVTAYQQRPINHVMSNSFGFGGNCSSLIFSKV